MDEEGSMDHTEQGDAVTQSTSEDNDTSSSPVKRGRGRPKGSVKVGLNSGVANGGDAAPKRGRGRPKLSKPAVSSDNTDSPVKKRGRPKGSTNKPRISGGATDLVNGSGEPKKRRGRPRKSTSAVSSTPGKRGRPRKVVTGQSNGISQGRGRPRKILGSDGSQLVKKKRGRPKGSLNKNRASSLEAKSPIKTGKRGRPRNQPAKRGRPRKYPVSKKIKNRVWKPLGRPRKYPREEPPEGAADGEGSGLVVRRGRGRPRKGESKKGAHLRKNLPASTETSGPPRKRGRPSSNPKPEGDAAATEGDVPRKRGRPASNPKPEGDAANEDVAPRKRGRPKGSVKLAESEDNGTPPNNCEDDSIDAEESSNEAEETVEEAVQDEMLVN